MRFGYVILHYKNIGETRKCIESLVNTADKSSVFLIVDNGSGDNSGEELKKEYAGLEQCRFLLLEENLGFSKGNNYGYDYMKKNYDVDFIVVANNDIVFYQKDFEKKISEIYVRTNFDVLGPDEYIPWNKEHQNPLFLKGITIDRLEKEIEEYKNYREHPEEFEKRLKVRGIKNRWCSRSALLRCVYSKLRGTENINYKKEYENIGLQGACLIVSKRFIDNEEKMFTPELFLYCEEIFLYYKCMDKGYKTVYCPEIGVRHEESASFKNANKNKLDRLRFMLEHHVIARERVLEYLREREQNR